jgi:hypothetical protein
MLRTFDLTSKWGIPEAAQGIALGGVGIAPGKTRRPARVGRGSADPARMPDRRAPDARPTRWARVSRPRPDARPTGLPRASPTMTSDVFVLAKLTPKEGDLSVKDLGRGQETRAQRKVKHLGRDQETGHRAPVMETCCRFCSFAQGMTPARPSRLHKASSLSVDRRHVVSATRALYSLIVASSSLH